MNPTLLIGVLAACLALAAPLAAADAPAADLPAPTHLMSCVSIDTSRPIPVVVDPGECPQLLP